MSFVLLFLLTFFLTLTLTVTLIRILLPFLRRHHVGQRILEIGPAWHSKKEGTPTMGGLAFLLSTTISLAVSGFLYAQHLPSLFWRPILLTVLYALSSAAVGIFDDMTKFKKSRNEGLTPLQKLVLQVTFAIAYVALLHLYGHLDTDLYLPYLNAVIELGPFYYLFAVVLAVGMVNFVNLSDGIDGLCASSSLVLGAFFAIAATYLGEESATLTATAMIGAALGFLFFNRHPARIFMGDTGSLFLGGLAVGCAFLLEMPLLLPIAGFVFVFEGISVVLQVVIFKLTGKRLFRMAPFHHHLERCGLSENRIVLFFVLAGLAFAALALLGLWL